MCAILSERGRDGGKRSEDIKQISIRFVCHCLNVYTIIQEWQWDNANIVPVSMKQAEPCTEFLVCTLTEMVSDMCDEMMCHKNHNGELYSVKNVTSFQELISRIVTEQGLGWLMSIQWSICQHNKLAPSWMGIFVLAEESDRSGAPAFHCTGLDRTRRCACYKNYV